MPGLWMPSQAARMYGSHRRKHDRNPESPRIQYLKPVLPKTIPLWFLRTEPSNIGTWTPCTDFTASLGALCWAVLNAFLSANVDARHRMPS